MNRLCINQVLMLPIHGPIPLLNALLWRNKATSSSPMYTPPSKSSSATHFVWKRGCSSSWCPCDLDRSTNQHFRTSNWSTRDEVRLHWLHTSGADARFTPLAKLLLAYAIETNGKTSQAQFASRATHWTTWVARKCSLVFCVLRLCSIRTTIDNM